MSFDKPSGGNRICVDWDGTCVEAMWPGMGDWLPGAREALHRLLDVGYEVIICSTRLAPTESDEATPRPEAMAREVLHVREMLNDAGLHDVEIWTRPWKPGAIAYIDDKAVKFDNNWPAITKAIGGGV